MLFIWLRKKYGLPLMVAARETMLELDGKLTKLNLEECGKQLFGIINLSPQPLQ